MKRSPTLSQKLTRDGHRVPRFLVPVWFTAIAWTIGRTNSLPIVQLDHARIFSQIRLRPTFQSTRKAWFLEWPMVQSRWHTISTSRRRQCATLYESPSSTGADDDAGGGSSMISDSSRSVHDDDLDMTRGYQWGQYLYGLVAAIVLTMPDRTNTVRLASKLGGVAGYGMAAGLCHILADASQNHRVSSGTYKRLNLGLLGFSFFGLVAVPAEAAFFRTTGKTIALSALMTAVRLYCTWLSWSGWIRGIDWKAKASNSQGTSVLEYGQRLLKELGSGTKETLVGLVRVRNKKKAMTYRNLALLMAVFMFHSVTLGFFNISYRYDLGKTLFDISMEWSGAARFFMISTIMYSLKDAAERDRLHGTTFIQLNTMIMLWSLAVGVGQVVIPDGLFLQRGAVMLYMAFVFMTKTLKGLKAKDERQKVILMKD